MMDFQRDFFSEARILFTILVDKKVLHGDIYDSALLIKLL